MNLLKPFCMLFLIALVAGCTKGDDARISLLEAKVIGLEKQVEQLQSRVKLQSELTDWEGVAYLTPGSDGYSVVKMDFGYLTVSLANIAPYANGSKVLLTFGNLTAATINGLKAKIEWGSVDAKGLPINDQAKTREIKLAESIFPGAWNKAAVVLEGVPPADLGFVRIRDVSHQGIRLRGQPD